MNKRELDQITKDRMKDNSKKLRKGKKYREKEHQYRVSEKRKAYMREYMKEYYKKHKEEDALGRGSVK